jgi:molybdopterin-guanine dinucleotide biosynthesis protein A
LSAIGKRKRSLSPQLRIRRAPSGCAGTRGGKPQDVSSGYDGVLLAGGESRRMGGRDKTRLQVGARSLVAIAVAALANADHTVVVGPDGDLREQPPGGGPVAALVAGLTRVTAPVVVVLAADLPFVTVDAVEQLVRSAPAIAVDDDGRRQYLLAAYRTAELRAVMPADAGGASLRSVIGQLPAADIRLTGEPPPWWDCDTPADLDQARSWHDAR